MGFRSRLVTAQVQAACRPFFCKNKIGNSWLTNAAFHGILIDVDGALAQLVAHNTGSVGVRSSNLLCSTIICLKTSVFRLFSCLFLIRLKRKNKRCQAKNLPASHFMSGPYSPAVISLPKYFSEMRVNSPSARSSSIA